MIIRALSPADAAERLRMRCALWPETSPEAHRAEMRAWLERPDAVVLVAARANSVALTGSVEFGVRR